MEQTATPDVLSEILKLSESPCLYFDLGDCQPHLPVLIDAVHWFEWRVATFLDKSVTHLVTDKASTILQHYDKFSSKWSVRVWTVQEFSAGIMAYIQFHDSTIPINPVLRRLASQGRKRDLGEFLADERKHQPAKPTRAITPLYAGVKAVGNVSVANVQQQQPQQPAPRPSRFEQILAKYRKPTDNLMGKTQASLAAPSHQATPHSSRETQFVPFKHVFVCFDDANYMHVPLWKEYPPSPNSQRKTYPRFYWDSPPLYCPWVAPPMWYLERKQREEQRAAAAIAEKENEVVKVSVPVVQKNRSSISRSSLPATNQRRLSLPFPVHLQSYYVSRAAKTATAPAATKAKPGYCECCNERYEELDAHRFTTNHRRYASEAANWYHLDSLIRSMQRPIIPKMVTILSPARSSIKPSSSARPFDIDLTTTTSEKTSVGRSLRSQVVKPMEPIIISTTPNSPVRISYGNKRRRRL